MVTTLPCVGQFDSDDAVYDPGTKRLYVASVPFVETFTQRSANNYQLLGQVPARFHAKTAILGAATESILSRD
jgi:hypothetical protein